MKKIFTLIVAALMAVGASADTTVLTAPSASVTSHSDANGIITITDGNGSTGVQVGSTFTNITFTNEKALKLSKDRDFNLSYKEGVTISKVTLYGTSNGTSTTTLAVDGSNVTPNLPAKGGSPAVIDITGAAKIRAAAQFLAIIVVEYSSTEPMLKATPEEISLSTTPSKTSASETFTLSGANLTAGTYNFNVPNLAGLSVNPTSFTVDSKGTVNQEVTVTYTSTKDVAKASANITATVGDLTATVAVNYQSRATAYTQATVTEDATWDWSALTETVQLTDETSPKKGDEYLLADVDDRIDFKDAFGDATALVVDLEYPSRAGYAQGNAIKFKTNRAGKLAVDFSNTGGNRPYRYLQVNGTSTTFKSATQDKVSATEIEVPAGEVVISGYIEDATDPQTKDGDVVGAAGLRFYKVVFTATGEPEDITGINTVAADAAQTGAVKKYVDGKQVVIIKNGKKYNVAGALIK